MAVRNFPVLPSLSFILQSNWLCLFFACISLPEQLNSCAQPPTTPQTPQPIPPPSFSIPKRKLLNSELSRLTLSKVKTPSCQTMSPTSRLATCHLSPPHAAAAPTTDEESISYWRSSMLSAPPLPPRRLNRWRWFGASSARNLTPC